MDIKIKINIIFLSVLFWGFYINAQDTTVKKIIVGIKSAPPFVISNEGFYSGVSLDLWEQIANDLDIVYEYKVYEEGQLDSLFEDLKNHKIDISINPLTITSERLKKVDFSVPFFSSNIAIALKKQNNSTLSIFKNFFTKKFLRAVLILFAIILSIGFIIWLVEKRFNDQFRKKPQGITDGFWWAAVTMTTVGYGDKYPKTAFGKLLAVVWMFASVILISSLTGSIAAALTINEFSQKINSIDDLKKLKIGTIQGSSSEEYLDKHNIKIFKSSYNSILEGLKDLNKGNIEAFIYDEAILQYLIKKNNLENSIYLSPYKLNAIYYSFALPKESKLIDTLNLHIIKTLESVYWLGVLNKYDLSD